MASHSFRPRRVEDWFDAVPNLLSDLDWDMEVEKPQASLSHCDCPWGDKLIRVTVAGITVQDPPVKKSHVLVRPEIRAALASSLVHQGEPGDAVVQRFADWGLLRLCSILFGDMAAGPAFTHDARRSKTPPVVTHQRLRRDYPSPGDSAYACFHDGDDAQEGFLMCSPDLSTENKFDLVGVFRMPMDQFSSWMSIHFQLLLDSACRASHWLLNGPRSRELRDMDQDAYVVLTIQSCKRGLPLYPLPSASYGVEPTVTIAAGEPLGLENWVRFSPCQVGSEKFRLSEYIQLFLRNLGQEVTIYSTMDGRKLVPYQCLLKREDWLRVRKQFVECFLLQKTAYRRANGGSTAPSLHEEVDPRFIQEKMPPSHTLQKMEKQRVERVRMVVRRTFLEVESDSDSPPAERQNVRPKTTTILPEDIPLLAA